MGSSIRNTQTIASFPQQCRGHLLGQVAAQQMVLVPLPVHAPPGAPQGHEAPCAAAQTSPHRPVAFATSLQGLVRRSGDTIVVGGLMMMGDAGAP